MHLDGKGSDVSKIAQVGVLNRCYLCCTPPSSSTLLEIIRWAMRIIPLSMQSFLHRFRDVK